MWCYKRDISQYHPKTQTESQVLNMVGTFSASESSHTHHIYRGSEADCKGNDGIMRKRYGEVEIKCCDASAFEQHQRHQKERDAKLKSFIAAVDEKEMCSYYLTVCSQLICENPESKYQKNELTDNSDTLTSGDRLPIWRRSDVDYAAAQINSEEQGHILRRIKDMFFFGYQSYMKSAFPEVSGYYYSNILCIY